MELASVYKKAGRAGALSLPSEDAPTRWWSAESQEESSHLEPDWLPP